MMSGDGYSLMPSAIEGFDHQLNPANPSQNQKSNPAVKKKRNLPGTPGIKQTLASFVSYIFKYSVRVLRFDRHY